MLFRNDCLNRLLSNNQQPKNIKSLIEYYFIWEGYPRTSLEIESPPNSMYSIVFNDKKDY